MAKGPAGPFSRSGPCCEVSRRQAKGRVSCPAGPGYAFSIMTKVSQSGACRNKAGNVEGRENHLPIPRTAGWVGPVTFRAGHRACCSVGGKAGKFLPA